MIRLLLPAGILLLLVGYFGPWVNHPVAGLVVTGLDLGEYVKFLPEVQSGEIVLWRPGFYAPLVASAAAAVLLAFRGEWGYPTWQRVLLLGIATVAMLNLVPPAWTPRRLLEPEFRVQTGSLVLLALALIFSPWLVFAPRRLVQVGIGMLLIGAMVLPAHGYFAVLPAIADLYHQALAPGWGLWVLWLGGAICGAALILQHRRATTAG